MKKNKKEKKIQPIPIWVTLLILYFLICGMRIWYSFSFAGPQNLGDATLYDSIAQSIVGGTFISSGAYAAVVPPGYPFLLSISYLFGPDKILIYHAQLILNVLVAGMVLFAAYWFLREWCTKEIAVIGSFLIATLPSISKSTGFIMSENLFIPLSLFAFYFMYRAFKTDSLYISLLAGIFTFSLFFTRSIGIVTFIALVCGLMWYCYQNQKNGTSFIENLRTKWGILAGAFIPFLIWEALLLGTGHAAVGYQQDVMAANYIQNIGTNFIHYFKIFFLQIDYIMLTSYVIGAVLALYTIFLIVRRTKEVTTILKRNTKEDNEDKALALTGVTGFALPLFVLFALAPLPLIASEVPYMYGRYYDPILPILFLFVILGIQYLMSKKSIPKLDTYAIFLTSITASLLIVLTLPWNSHFDAVQNAPILYLSSISTFYEYIIIILLFGVILSLMLLAGVKKLMIIRGFIILLVLMNAIIFFPMVDTEITISNNYDRDGSVGKYIMANVNNNELIIFDDSTFDNSIFNDSKSDGFWSTVYYALIDYWVTNNLRRVNLTKIALSGDYTDIQDGDYIITMLKGSTEPLYVSPSGLSLYSL